MKTRSRRVRAIASLAVVLVLTLGYAVLTFVEIRLEAREDKAGAADVIIVMGAAQYNGAPSPVLRTRLDHARSLFEAGHANIIVTTGGYGPDPNFSEAQVGTAYLVEHGVDGSQILTEQGSGSTRDTVQAVVRLMHSHGWTRAIVVSDGFHLYRLREMLEANDIEVLTSPVHDSVLEASSANRVWFSLREVVLLTLYRLGVVFRLLIP